jgi:hypothetical protein
VKATKIGSLSRYLARASRGRIECGGVMESLRPEGLSYRIWRAKLDAIYETKKRY